MDDLWCDRCGVSQWGLWLCPLWVEQDCHELLLWWLNLSHCCEIVASIQIRMTWAVMSFIVGLWSGLASSFLIFPVVPQAQSDMVTFVCLVMYCWYLGRRFSVWAVHDDAAIFIAFIASDVRTMLTDVSWILTLKAAILFIWHHV